MLSKHGCLKYNFTLVFLVILIFVAGCSISSSRYWIRSDIEGLKINISSPRKGLQIGEKFTYKAEWLGLDVGIATLSVEGITKLRDRDVYHILVTVNSTDIISKLYKVEDKISTYMDMEEL